MSELKNLTTMPSTPTAATTAPSSSAPTTNKKKAPGLQFRRHFTKPGVSPYDEIEWELRLAQITDAQGNTWACCSRG
jgi:ribonucleoside-diphosphate reductase alpha chain